MKFTVGIDVLVNEAGPDLPKKQKENDKLEKKKKLRFDKREPTESKLSPLKYNNYTPLNTTCTNILIEIYNKDIIN